MTIDDRARLQRRQHAKRIVADLLRVGPPMSAAEFDAAVRHSNVAPHSMRSALRRLVRMGIVVADGKRYRLA